MDGDPREQTRSVTRSRRNRGVSKRSKRKLWLGVAGVTLLLLLGIFATAAYSYMRASARVAPKGAEAVGLKQQLTTATVGPEYVLVLGDDRRPGQDRGNAEAVILVRLDSVASRATILSLPSETIVSTASGTEERFTSLYTKGGAPSVVQGVEQFTGLPVNHYVRLDFEGLVHVVDAIGGLYLTVDANVDNSYLGQPASEVVRVPKGYHKLSGVQVLVYLKDRSGKNPAKLRSARQQQFLTALLGQLASTSHLAQLPAIADSISQNMMTDMSMSQLLDMAATFRKVPKADIFKRSLPGKAVGTGTKKPFIADAAKAKLLFDAVRSDGGASVK